MEKYAQTKQQRTGCKHNLW